MTSECINCKKLGACPIVTEEKLTSSYVCSDWVEAPTEQVKARKRVLEAFKSSGASSLLTTTASKED